MKNKNLIYRSIGTFDQNSDENSRTISGVAIVFDSYSRDLGGFIERIDRGAISEDFLANQDVIMNVDHDNSRMLARYNHGEGTLQLSLEDDGLHFQFEAPNTSLGDEVLYNVRNGNLFECSFACYLNRNDIDVIHEDDQTVHVIKNIRALLDCSIVVHAAYPDTDVQARNLELAEKQAEIDAEKKAEEERQEEERKAKIINDLDEKLKSFYNSINI